MKQTFNIPDGCKTVSVEQIGNQIITSFEPEKYVPKVGDCVKITYNTGNVYFLEVTLVRFNGRSHIIHSGEVVIGENGEIFKAQIVSTFKSIEKLTPEEFQEEFEKLGYVYDFETHTAKKKRKMVAVGKRYFYADMFFEIYSYIDKRDSFDDQAFELGNYFETRAECQKYCDYMRECSLKYFNK
jgi:hypothetical protein